MAQKPHEPTAEKRVQVETLGGVGVPHHAIARIIGCGDRQLLRYYKNELASGKAKATSNIAQRLYAVALKEGPGGTCTTQSLAAMIFWLKSQAGWRETQVHQVIGDKGGPVRMQSMSKIDPIKAARAYAELMG